MARMGEVEEVRKRWRTRISFCNFTEQTVVMGLGNSPGLLSGGLSGDWLATSAIP